MLEDKKITMVAQCLVKSSEAGVEEKIKTFDAAWHRALDLQRPVSVYFLGFVRKD